jgi:hypothetical protein
VIGEIFSLFANDDRLDYAAYGRFIDFKKSVMCVTAPAIAASFAPSIRSASVGRKGTLGRCRR